MPVVIRHNALLGSKRSRHHDHFGYERSVDLVAWRSCPLSSYATS